MNPEQIYRALEEYCKVRREFEEASSLNSERRTELGIRTETAWVPLSGLRPYEWVDYHDFMKQKIKKTGRGSIMHVLSRRDR